ncbi:MAG TPA: DNA methyltransferase [Thermoanaerobaculia bacterium]|nr:DNA methyltransferase [Thermoanaerobaculia bacterium]
MQDAYGQALGYARTLGASPPFLIICDIGYCFDLYASFDGSGNYRKWPDALASRIYLRDLERHKDTFRKIFTDPHALDQSKIAARVTRDIAGHIASLARALEAAGHKPELVAQFLMRCLFTMFAEDVELIQKGLFAKALQDRWIANPELFQPEAENLWKTMNEGGNVFGVGKILRFNGGLFRDPSALPLTKAQLIILGLAAASDWRDVEPAIFGTLLERALDPKERHRLGAHFTPRAYVERLVRPTIEEPLRNEWEAVRAEVRQIMDAGKSDDDQKAMVAARKPVYAFYDKLTRTRVLDPACGSGNFLYVTLDLFKRIENEILALLQDLGDNAIFNLHGRSVTPEQFLGIEIKPWAKEIAELVLWIGYLQWQIRNRGWMSHVPEPVLRDYQNIECRDAVLAYDGVDAAVDDEGKPITRWDGETMKKHPVTGEDVPDETARTPVLRYINPRKAKWPKADYIVGNPPYIGARRIRDALGDSYVEALRAAYTEEVPDTADLVMFWWHRAALTLKDLSSRAFGFITTNSIVQTYSRMVIERHLSSGVRLRFVVPDHPWVENASGADVRVAMTVATLDIPPLHNSVLCLVGSDDSGVIPSLSCRNVVKITADLRSGTNVRELQGLKANRDMCFQGVVPAGDGFKLTPAEARGFASEQHFIKPYIIGRDLVRNADPKFIIDFFGWDEAAARVAAPHAYQRLLDRVLPDRLHNKRDTYRKHWWIFAEPRPNLRRALTGLRRFIGTPYTAKFRPFIFIASETLPDAMVYAIPSDDAFILGVLSSRLHGGWASVAGGRMGVGNDSRYTSRETFAPFPFPTSDDSLKEPIRHLGERLDAHRKRQQTLNSDLTVTGMYNVLQNLRSGEALTAKDKVIHEQGLVSVLKQIHDDLDAAVFDAYGWPHDLTDEQILERLVALNAERAEEEKRGIIRWLRPEFQNPDNRQQLVQQQIEGASAEVNPAKAAAVNGKPAWPKSLPDQLTAIRDTFHQTTTALDATSVASSFKGARTKEVGQLLASLEALGHLISVSDSPKQWRAAR